ncbi:MAG: universal stress protein [Candidatus Promineifilaceae bacterium]
MFTKILVPLDGSGVAEHAITPALDLVKKYDGILVLLCTCAMGLTNEAREDLISDRKWFWSKHLDDPVYIEGKEYLNGVIANISEPGIEIQSMLVRGDEAGAIIGIAEAQDINLIVMTKHCRPGYQSLLGDITERVLYHASCPVMVICSNLYEGRESDLPGSFAQTTNELDSIRA